jgi:hypothetical protein
MFTRFCIPSIINHVNDNKILTTVQEHDVITSVITASRHNKFHSRVYDTILLGIYSKVYGKIKYYD